MLIFQKILAEASQVTPEEIGKLLEKIEKVNPTNKVLGQVAAEALNLLVLRDKTLEEANLASVEHLKSHLNGSDHNCAEFHQTLERSTKKANLLSDLFWAECREIVGVECPKVIGCKVSEGELVIVEIEQSEIDHEERLEPMIAGLGGEGDPLEQLLTGSPFFGSDVHVIKIGLGARPKSSIFERFFR